LTLGLEPPAWGDVCLDDGALFRGDTARLELDAGLSGTVCTKPSRDALRRRRTGDWWGDARGGMSGAVHETEARGRPACRNQPGHTAIDQRKIYCSMALPWRLVLK